MTRRAGSSTELPVRYDSENAFGSGTVLSWASIVDGPTLEQARTTSRSAVLQGHLALMPDAHLGVGATVGSVLRSRDAIIPAAVGVDIGCGMIAVRTDLERGRLNLEASQRILRRIAQWVPAGFGRAHPQVQQEARRFIEGAGWAPGIAGDADTQQRALSQFGTLGEGNHFAEVAEDSTGHVWAVVHTGSRGVGNRLATHHIAVARAVCAASDYPLEDPSLAHLSTGTAEFVAYIHDMLWAQDYAYWQREAIMTRVLTAVEAEAPLSEVERINCHHNYSEEVEPGIWLTRKGAIAARETDRGIIPGSMGAATYVVRGLGNTAAYESSPHGAGRLLSRGAAHRGLDLKPFLRQMNGKVWQQTDAVELLDEAPLASKPIEQVMADARLLVEPTEVLSQFINYKGVGRRRGVRGQPGTRSATGRRSRKPRR